jgi:hypothetical protein
VKPSFLLYDPATEEPAPYAVGWRLKRGRMTSLAWAVVRIGKETRR